LPSGLPVLPPVFDPILHLREGQDAMRRAVALAPEKGAGCLVWASGLDHVEAAVVLEPERILTAARPALLCAANALGDALAAIGAPEIPIAIRWPAEILLNGAEVARLTLAEPAGVSEDAVPDWLVAGFTLRLGFAPGHEGGRDPDRTALREEGEPEVEATDIVAGWARHLMANMAEWQAPDGGRRLAEKYLARLEHAPWQDGARRGLDPVSGDLVLDRDGRRDRIPLAAALEKAA
jgi:biotin-(acetyl-CoA carboxylase) ligase